MQPGRRPLRRSQSHQNRTPLRIIFTQSNAAEEDEGYQPEDLAGRCVPRNASAALQGRRLASAILGCYAQNSDPQFSTALLHSVDFPCPARKQPVPIYSPFRILFCATSLRDAPSYLNVKLDPPLKPRRSFHSLRRDPSPDSLVALFPRPSSVCRKSALRLTTF